MWSRANMYYPIMPTPEPVKPAVTLSTLSDALHAAIDKDDAGLARQALEEAFWRKIEFTPDIFHLCRALEKQNRDLVRLLATYGIKPNAAEALAAAQFVRERNIDVEPLLRGTGISLSTQEAVAAESTLALHARISLEVSRKNLRESFNRLGLSTKVRSIVAESMGIELNAQQTITVINELHKNLKDDVVPQDIASAIALLKQTRANFTGLDANKYLGKKGPGLAKTLLDMGIIGADAFDMRTLIKKVGGEIKIFTAESDKNFAYTEFVCQVSLEIADPARFVPLRAEPDAAREYQKHFCDKWVRQSQPDLTYRLKGPKNK